MEIGARVIFVEAINGVACIRAVLTALKKAGAAGKGFALIAGDSFQAVDLSGSTLMDGMLSIRQVEGRKADLGFSNDHLRIYVRKERRESEREERYRGRQRKRTTLCSSKEIRETAARHCCRLTILSCVFANTGMNALSQAANAYDAVQVLVRAVAPYFAKIDGGYGAYIASDPIKRMRARGEAMTSARNSRLDPRISASGPVAFDLASNDRASSAFVFNIINHRKSSPDLPVKHVVVGRVEKGVATFTSTVSWPGNTSGVPADRSSYTVPPTMAINIVGKGDNHTDLILKLAIAQQVRKEETERDGIKGEHGERIELRRVI